MSAMEFILVAHAIIVGLGVAEVLRGFADHLRARHARTCYRLLLLAAWTLLLLLQVWWAIWNVRHKVSWTFPEFLVFLLPVVILYVLARLCFPDGQGPSDLREYYREMSPKIWVLVAATYVSFIFIQPMLYERFVPAIIATQVAIAVAAIVASRYRARYFHFLVIAAMFLQVAWRGLPQVIHG